MTWPGSASLLVHPPPLAPLLPSDPLITLNASNWCQPFLADGEKVDLNKRSKCMRDKANFHTLSNLFYFLCFDSSKFNFWTPLKRSLGNWLWGGGVGEGFCWEEHSYFFWSYLPQEWRNIRKMREALPIAMNKSVTWKIKILNQHTLKKKKKDELWILGGARQEIKNQIN